jgi:hypothetical protein
MDGKQGGDPAKLADALVELVALRDPPTRFAAGADAIQTLEGKARALLGQAQPTASYRALSRTTMSERVRASVRGTDGARRLA